MIIVLLIKEKNEQKNADEYDTDRDKGDNTKFIKDKTPKQKRSKT